MNIIYVSSTCSREKYGKYIERKGQRVSQQAQKYNLLLAEGLATNNADVRLISTRPINRSVEKAWWIKAEKECVNGIAFHYIPFVNHPVLRKVFLLIGVFFAVLFAKGTKKDTVVICDGLNISASMGAQPAARLRGFRTVGIITDVPGLSCEQTFTGTQKINRKIMERFDSYLLLTKQMSDIVNPQKRPYIVLEGHADCAMAAVENVLAEKSEKKIVLYAGSLMRVYGIEDLVEGFLSAQISDAELHIYGNGDYEEELKILAQQHPEVKYLGVAPNAEIVKAELAATLLVNPRPSNEEYTKYSFPSKNMEYMASGTPVLTTRLPGMPEDHKPYVYFIEREDAEGVKEALVRVLSQDAQTLHDFGAKAKDFVLKEKNNCAQAAKVIAFINEAFDIH